MKEILGRRKTGMPLQRAIGEANFFGLDLDIENVLIPRSETELLVDEARKYIENLLAQNAETADNFSAENPNKIGGFSEKIYNKIGGIEPRKIRVLDLATGSGAIAIALDSFFGEGVEITASDISGLTAQNNPKEHPLIVEITASDISEAALRTARKNAEKYDAKIDFIRSDMFENVGGGYDVIISNPPYIKTSDIPSLDIEVRDFEPRIALDGGEDGLSFYRIIASKILNNNENQKSLNGDEPIKALNNNSENPQILSGGESRKIQNDPKNPKILNDGGRLFFEIGAGQREDIEKIFEGVKIEFVKDYSGIDRIGIVKI
jgi:release factor glutamine methyltransferase